MSLDRVEGAIHIAYCPERVLPGNVMHEFVENDVIGGVDEFQHKKQFHFIVSIKGGYMLRMPVLPNVQISRKFIQRLQIGWQTNFH